MDRWRTDDIYLVQMADIINEPFKIALRRQQKYRNDYATIYFAIIVRI